MLPKVTVITVTYNAADLLAQTMESVLAQDYPNLEYWVIDGKSKDNSLEVIKKYEADERLRWLSETDKNLYDAMNKGLEKATGEFVGYIHAGDLLPEKNTLSKLFENFENEDFIYGEAEVYFPDGRRKGWHKTSPKSETLSPKTFAEGMVICHQAMWVRRTCLAPYDLRFPLAGDIDWSIRFLEKVQKAKHVPEVVVHFLGGGLSKQRHRASLLERFQISRMHFGLPYTLWIHFKILLKAIF